MRIAQVSPLFESVPPKAYGGTERIVFYLTEALVRQGHDVTLFASGDSSTRARLIATSERSLRLDENCSDRLAPQIIQLEEVIKRASEFDVIHFHIDYIHFPLSRRQSVPHVTTLHGRLDMPELEAIYKEFPEVPLVSISDAQREPLPWVNWIDTVYHGVPQNLYTLRNEPGEYLAFLGRISPEKRPDRAIQIAKRFKMPLKIAAKVDAADRDYFEGKVRPLLEDSGSLIEFVGEIGEEQKNDFLGKAYALLFPIDWPEPFGIVMVEAMACGTPVIAYPRGSVLEVLEDGVTGFIVEDIDAAVKALEHVPAFNRNGCRQAFEMRFTASRMARDYVRVYEKLIGKQSTVGEAEGESIGRTA